MVIIYTNANITIYNKYLDKEDRLDAYKRTVIKNVFWDESKATNRLQSGLIDVDKVLALIPFENLDMSLYRPPKEFDGEEGTFTFQSGDRIVKGEINLEITKTTDLDRKYEAFTISSVDKKDFGSKNMRHFEIGAK